MSTPSFDRGAFKLTLFIAIVLVLLPGAMAVYVLSDPGINQAIVIVKAVSRVHNSYYQDIPVSQLVRSFRMGMFQQLDPYSTFIEETGFTQMKEEQDGAYGGIGVMVLRHDDGLLIMSVNENGPASLVGLLSGDIILTADSIQLSEISSNEATSLLRGKEGTSVRVDIYRPATADTFSVTIERKRIPYVHVPYAGITRDSLLYIRLLNFSPGSSRDVKSALDSLLLKNPEQVRGVILDLRGNPGGLFHEAYQTADLFLDEGDFIVGTSGRSKWNDEVHFAVTPDMTGGRPIALLVNKGSASASEIVAGALQQNDRAILVGDTTFGKGLVQGFVRFPGGNGIKLTISRYYFGDSLFLNEFDSTLHDVGHGLVPDEYVASVPSNRLIRQLEASLLLQEYATKHQDEILKIGNTEKDITKLIDNLLEFIDQHDIQFYSDRTILVSQLFADAEYEQASKQTMRLVDNLFEISHSADREQLEQFGEYIHYRLLRLASERKYGIPQTYADVVLQYQPEILRARKLLGQEKVY